MKCKYIIFDYSTYLPAQQNKGPEQHPSSNICVGRIILLLKVFNLPCQTYYSKLFPRLPTSQQNTNTLQSSKRNKPLESLTHERLTPLTSGLYKSILFTFTVRQIHGSSQIDVATVVLRNSYHRSPARLKIKCVRDNYSTNLLLLPHCSNNHSECHTKRSKMHGEHGKFIAYYTQGQPVLSISCAGLLTTNCKIQVPSSDTTPYVYMWVSGVRYCMKYILLLGKFNLSTYHLLCNLAQAIILLTCI